MRTLFTRCLVLVALALFAVAAVHLSPTADDPARAQDSNDEQVRVRARLQADGDIEFGLRTSEGNVAPRARIFSAGVTHNRWLVSSPLELVNGAEIRIIARREGDTRVEFGVRTTDPQEVYLPPQRYFPRSTAVGRWLISTPVSIPAPPAPEVEADEPAPPPEPPAPEPETTPDVEENETSSEAEDSDEPSESVERISGGHRDGLAVINGVLGDPDAPVLISEYGDPF